MPEMPAVARLGFSLDECPNELVLGTFDSGLTVYDQQIRALNLVFRLHEDGCFDPDRPIAVIGAGIAGLTFAAGCLWLGHKVLLLEKQPVPCHLQRGCDIRWIHPHIYHWPRPGSDQPYAGLPLLSWAEGTASEVARQITTQWDKLKQAAGNNLLDVYGAHHEFLSREPFRIQWRGYRDAQREQAVAEVSHVVYAVGFGVEQGHSSVKAHSYWENDSFNQLRPDHPPGVKVKWLVSGMDDGALIDLQRSPSRAFDRGASCRSCLVINVRWLSNYAGLPRDPTSLSTRHCRGLRSSSERLMTGCESDCASIPVLY